MTMQQLDEVQAKWIAALAVLMVVPRLEAHLDRRS
jgi:hypothetical protein